MTIKEAKLYTAHDEDYGQEHFSVESSSKIKQKWPICFQNFAKLRLEQCKEIFFNLL